MTSFSFYPPPSKNNAVLAFAYHVFAALTLLLGGAGLLALGIWLQVRDNGHALLLEHGPNRFLDFVLEAGIFGLFLGIFFIIVAVNALIARASRCAVGCVYTIFSIFVLFLLFTTSVVSWVVYAQRNTTQVRGFYSNAWKYTMKRKPLAICEIEKALTCRGFDDISCHKEKCAVCPPRLRVRQRTTSCYPAIVKDLAQNFLPTAIGSLLLTIVLLVDLIVHCRC